MVTLEVEDGRALLRDGAQVIADVAVHGTGTQAEQRDHDGAEALGDWLAAHGVSGSDMVGRTVAAAAVVDGAPGAWGLEPLALVLFTDGTAAAFVLPADLD